MQTHWFCLGTRASCPHFQRFAGETPAYPGVLQFPLRTVIMDVGSKIYVAGHSGLVGSAICRALLRDGYTCVVTRTHSELDLCDQTAVNSFFSNEKPEYVFLAAAKVGGIAANVTFPADFVMKNLMIGINVINACFNNGVKKLLFLGSNCSYPRDCLTRKECPRLDGTRKSHSRTASTIHTSDIYQKWRILKC